MSGIPILGCLPGSPAEEVGLEYGDILLSVNGVAMKNIQDFLEVRAHASGSLEIVVQRGNRLLELTVPLRKPPKMGVAQIVGALSEARADRLIERQAMLDGPGDDDAPN